ncbi:hypothetical protein V2A85_11330 [Yersinia sp. 1252 StPb PI]|uniref:hypothetical protein n=1 Tax=Yersinia sp. 1252 StPb PI TaxID=3117404 RepID=UPI003B2849BC
MMKSGFIRHPWSKEKDSIRASVLVTAIEDRAHKSCGLYYEIFHQRVIDELVEILGYLNKNDVETLTAAAAFKDYKLDEDSLLAVSNAYREVLNEIQQDQY